MTCMANTCVTRGLKLMDGLDCWVGVLGLRLLLAYEFWQSGVEKFRGDNWFVDIQPDFPFPFSVVQVDVSWFLSTWVELVGPVMLVLGLGTRFWAFSLLILDAIAWQAVHAGNGYNVCDNGYKLALMYLVMLIPLVLSGPGKLSMDHWLRQRFTEQGLDDD